MPASKKPRKRYKEPHFDTRRFGQVPSLFRVKQREVEVGLNFHLLLDALKRGNAPAHALQSVRVRLMWGLGMSINHFESAVSQATMAEALAASDLCAQACDRGLPLPQDQAEVIAFALTHADEMHDTLTRREAAQSLVWARDTFRVDISAFRI